MEVIIQVMVSGKKWELDHGIGEMLYARVIDSDVNDYKNEKLRNDIIGPFTAELINNSRNSHFRTGNKIKFIEVDGRAMMQVSQVR